MKDKQARVRFCFALAGLICCLILVAVELRRSLLYMDIINREPVTLAVSNITTNIPQCFQVNQTRDTCFIFNSVDDHEIRLLGEITHVALLLIFIMSWTLFLISFPSKKYYKHLKTSAATATLVGGIEEAIVVETLDDLDDGMDGDDQKGPPSAVDGLSGDEDEVFNAAMAEVNKK